MNSFIFNAKTPQLLPDGGYSRNQYQTIRLEITDRIISGIQVAPAASTLEHSPDHESFDANQKLLLPGWVNAHTHSMESWTRGLIPPLPLELWLAELYAHPLQQVEQIYLAAALTAIETLLSGGTTVVDHLVLMPGYELESLAAADRAYRQAGIRAYIAPLIQDEPFEYSIPNGRSLSPSPVMPTAEVLALMEEIVEKFHRPEDGIHIAIAPTGIQLCSDELFVGAADLSDRHGICRHGHLLETLAQQKLAQEKYGTTAVEHLYELGYLSPKTSLAHCIWLSDREIELMAETGTTAVHNPLSNLRLGSGIAPLLKYRQQGVNVSLGCDGSASNDGQSLFEVLKIGSMLHNLTDADYRNWLSPQEICRMASEGGMKGMGDEPVGRLAVNQEADLVLYDVEHLSMLPTADPLGQLIWCRPQDVVDSVWVRGQQVVANGAVIGIDTDNLAAQIRRYSSWHQTRPKISPMREKMEATFRQAMGLPE